MKLTIFRILLMVMNRKNVIMFSAFTLFFFNSLFAQYNSPLNREWSLIYQEENNQLSRKVRANDSVISKAELIDYSCFQPFIVVPIHIQKDKSKSYFYRKIKKENFIIVNDTADRFYLTLDPLFNFELAKDIDAANPQRLYTNTRGFRIKGDIDKKFVFESSFYENQSTFPDYIDAYITSTNALFKQKGYYEYNVIPGQGRSKKFKKNGYDYAMASGYISYSPNKIINLQAGHGKHFIGNGYRSLLLSDNAFNYPYLRITTTYRNIQYTNLYTSFINLTDGGVKTPPNIERLFQKKIGSFQLLSVNLWSRLQLGLFQAMIWEATDTMNRQHVNFNTFNPVIGVNSLIYGLHSKNNMLLGLNVKFIINNSINLYGQYLLDDATAHNYKTTIGNKNGYQLGFKYFNMFRIKNLHLQAEYNQVRPYVYAATQPAQSYTHYNQSLAHPLGANFKEVVGFLNYKKNRFFTELKIVYGIKGVDTLFSNFGGNVFKADNVNTFTGTSPAQINGNLTTIRYQQIYIGYLLNEATNLNIIAGVSYRVQSNNEFISHSMFIFFGIRTSLRNFYYDF
ncbi:MAG: hypothetical protein ABI315_04145 [Bacteroidia bacterium]